MSSPFLSIVIPTFNSGQTVERCLGSILCQTCADFEILVMDGGSDDQTISLVKGVGGDTRKLKWISERDHGIYDAMNKGVCMATGQWLLFLGSDDYLHDETVLADVRSAIASNPKTKFVYGDIQTSIGYLQKFDHFSFDRLIEKNICHQAIFYHASLFSSFKYDSNLMLLADWDFNLRVYRDRNRPLYISRVITVYNMEGASANWLEGEEYNSNFRDTRRLYLRHKGVTGYYQYLFRSKLYSVKRAVKSFMQRRA